MLKKVCELLGLIFILLAGVVFLGVPTAQAQSATPESSEACRNCHESLYLLRDTGKSFCLCAQKMTCTCCHGGNPQSLIAEEAHQGMVLSPVHGDSAPCQQCHADDADARVEQFAAVAGVGSFHPAAPTQTAFAAASLALPAAPGPLHWLDAWQRVGLAGLGVGLVILVIFGYRCWKADCLPKIQKSNL